MPLMPRVRKKKGTPAGQMGGRVFTEGRWMNSPWSNAGAPWQPRLRRCRMEGRSRVHLVIFVEEFLLRVPIAIGVRIVVVVITSLLVAAFKLFLVG